MNLKKSRKKIKLSFYAEKVVTIFFLLNHILRKRKKERTFSPFHYARYLFTIFYLKISESLKLCGIIFRCFSYMNSMFFVFCLFLPFSSSTVLNFLLDARARLTRNKVKNYKNVLVAVIVRVRVGI